MFDLTLVLSNSIFKEVLLRSVWLWLSSQTSLLRLCTLVPLRGSLLLLLLLLLPDHKQTSTLRPTIMLFALSSLSTNICNICKYWANIDCWPITLVSQSIIDSLTGVMAIIAYKCTCKSSRSPWTWRCMLHFTVCVSTGAMLSCANCHTSGLAFFDFLFFALLCPLFTSLRWCYSKFHQLGGVD